MVIRHNLENLHVAPFGQLFTKDNNDKFIISAQLNFCVKQFNALESLNLLSYATTQDKPGLLKDKGVNAGGKIIAWDPAPLNEAIDIMLGFQQFRQRWWQQHGSRTEPFYATALRARLRQVIDQLIHQSQIREYTQKPDQLLISKDEESYLSSSIVSFERVEGMIRQLQTLFIQEGDSGNATLLKNQTNGYVYEQLQILTDLVNKNRLYSPLLGNNWHSHTLAGSLFSYNDPKALASYLENQRQRLSFMAQNYAKPLVSYLIDTSTIAKTSNNARLWYDTLLELRQYDRQQPGNNVTQLQQYIGEQLAQQTWESCDATLATPQVFSSGGLFSQRHYQIDQTVRKQCKNYANNTVLRQYFALVERFNNDIKGQFPFAKYNDKQRIDIKPKVLDDFITDYQKNWGKAENGKSLLSSLENYLAQNPQADSDNWINFVKKIDQFANFYQQVLGKAGNIDITLDVEFNARLTSSQGQDQIIEWQLNSGADSAIFPNGNRRVQWQPGDALSLSLRWAKGSKFIPLNGYQSPQHVEPDSSVARFDTKGQWSLFEWLQQYGLQSISTSRKNWLGFSVPVGIKTPSTETEEPQTPAYISRINIAVSAIIADANGREKHLAVPSLLPFFAPGLPDGDT
ncbi:hypothetical protein AB835_00505 [Candidatus Endobugula sertula]|uniref:Uncharacterized protein n=1 Tax=Candidatus Endobugula sertula TaxID=62101 RepID=A0A1D2QTV3_9GAMM|nr:hypothetical protein AB835_00505 [Candidatus Endobugula sertula]